jgi:hypothetical protein
MRKDSRGLQPAFTAPQGETLSEARDYDPDPKAGQTLISILWLFFLGSRGGRVLFGNDLA